MRACLTGNLDLPAVAGLAVFAFLCGGGFWVLKSRALNPAKEKHTDADVEEGEDRISELPDADVEEGVDGISELPDDVMSLIISRLHARDAVRTSILSRRWRHAYTFTTEVRFSSFADHTQRKLVQAVDTILQRHSGSNILSFELVCCYCVCVSEAFRRWIDSVSRLGVERLIIAPRGACDMQQVNHPAFSFDLPPEASSLKHLRLKFGSFRTANRNALKILELEFVALTSEAVEGLLLNCSSLQSLKFMYCVLPSKLSIRGPDLQLKNLTAYHCSEVVEVDLSAVNLSTLYICDLRMLTLSFSSVPLLQNLFIQMCGSDVTPCVFEKVAKDLPHLKSMFFHTQANSFEGSKTARVIQNLSNLKQLDLFLEDRNKLDLLALATILDVCPLLHKFHLAMVMPSTFKAKQAYSRVVRRHALLKEVEFSGFSGRENECNFIFYILDNVVSLERLSICVHYRVYEVGDGRWLTGNSNPSDDEKKRRIIRERLQGKAISKNTEIIIA